MSAKIVAEPKHRTQTCGDRRPVLGHIHLAVLAALVAGAAHAQEGTVALVPTSDYGAVCADLTQVPAGSPYRWTVNGATSGEGVVAAAFCLPADDDLVTAQGDEPLSTDGVRFVPGRFGQSFVAPSGGVPFASTAYDPGAGTIEFWVSPVGDGTSAPYAADLSFFACAAANGDTLHVRQAATGVVCAQAVIGGTYLSAYSDLASMRGWRAGEWHHIAFVYSERANYMRVYVDGRPAGAGCAARYNDGSPATLVVLEPFDGIALRRR